jgi:hypothetical protein
MRELAIRACLQPFITARIMSRFYVNAQRSWIDRIMASVMIHRGPLLAIERCYQALWQA